MKCGGTGEVCCFHLLWLGDTRVFAQAALVPGKWTWFWAAGLAIGINTFWRGPTVIGDCAMDGDEAWPVGEENAGVADRELPRETTTTEKSLHQKSVFIFFKALTKYMKCVTEQSQSTSEMFLSYFSCDIKRNLDYRNAVSKYSKGANI